MKLSKEQVVVLEKQLDCYFGMVKLVCDGYHITLRVERVKNLRYRVMTYVNECFKGAWCDAEKECPEQKFLRKLVRPLYSPARKREMEKVMGKRYVKNNTYFSLSITYYMPDWASGKAALSHLNKVCESIQLAE